MTASCEIEAKGWLPDVVVRSGSRRWTLTVYDPIRLSQEVDDELRNSAYVALPNVLVIPQVTREAIAAAVAELAASDFADLS